MLPEVLPVWQIEIRILGARLPYAVV